MLLAKCEDRACQGTIAEKIAILTNVEYNSNITLARNGVSPEFASVPFPCSTLDFGIVPLGSIGTLGLDISNLTLNGIFDDSPPV